MNSIGRLFRVSIIGESHGEFAGVIIDGCPAGLQISEADFETDIERRKGGVQKGTTPRKETDLPLIKTGVFKGYTTGAPLTILFANENTRSSDYEKQRATPRPGHSDFVAGIKAGGFEDYRGGGHYSGRMTVAMVAAGVVAKKLLSPVKVEAKILEVAGESDIEKGLQIAIDNKDSVGGIVECRVNGLPAGLGEPFFDSMESVLAHMAFSIPAVKGVEFGAGFAAAKMFGSVHNDPIISADGKTSTNHAGGIVAGLTNGNELIYRIAVKPTASTPKEQQTWNREKEMVDSFSVKGRHDLCIALRVPVVLEAATAIVLADQLMLEQKIKRVLG